MLASRPVRFIPSSRILFVAAVHTAALCLVLVPGVCSGAPIHEAAKDNDVAQILELLANGADANDQDDRQRFTPLHAAAGRGSKEAVQALLDAGADPDLEDKYGRTAIEYSVSDPITWNKTYMRGQSRGMGEDSLWHREVFDLLVNSGATLRPDVLLLQAVMSNDPELLDLIASKFVADLPVDDGRYVYNATTKGAHESIRWLTKRHFEVNEPIVNEFTPLHVAAMHGDVAAVKLLLDGGAQESIFKKDRHGRTPAESMGQPTPVPNSGEIRAILGRAVSQEKADGRLAADVSSSCFELEMFRPVGRSEKPPRVQVANGSLKVFRSSYNTTGITVTGDEGGLEAEGGLPGGAGPDFVYRFSGKSTVTRADGQPVVFEGAPDDPVTFVLTGDHGLVYVAGKGTVKVGAHDVVALPCEADTGKSAEAPTEQKPRAANPDAPFSIPEYGALGRPVELEPTDNLVQDGQVTSKSLDGQHELVAVLKRSYSTPSGNLVLGGKGSFLLDASEERLSNHRGSPRFILKSSLTVRQASDSSYVLSTTGDDDYLHFELSLTGTSFLFPMGAGTMFCFEDEVVDFIQGYSIYGDPGDPLCFELLEQSGLTYRSGSGRVSKGGKVVATFGE